MIVMVVATRMLKGIAEKFKLKENAIYNMHLNLPSLPYSSSLEVANQTLHRFGQ